MYIHVKNPFPGNISTRLRMYKVLLFKFRRPGSIVLHDKGNFISICLLKRKKNTKKLKKKNAYPCNSNPNKHRTYFLENYKRGLKRLNKLTLSATICIS